MRAGPSPLDWKTLGWLGAIFLLVLVLWGTVIVTPLKILVVLLHEISHGMAAWLTGGSILRIEVNHWQGGVCVTAGGSRFIVASAGYLGSMIWGCLLLVLAARSRLDRVVTIALGAVLLLMTLLYVRNLFGFGFGCACAAGLLAAGWKLPDRANDMILKVIGLTSCLYAILDIVDDVLRRPGIGSDADMLAGLTGIPAVIWGALWIIAALGAAVLALWFSVRSPGQEERNESGA